MADKSRILGGGLPHSREVPDDLRLLPEVSRKVLFVLTGSVFAGALAVITVYQLARGPAATLSQETLRTFVAVLVSVLFLALVIIIVLVWLLLSVKHRYKRAVAPIYRHHPLTEPGISAREIRPVNGVLRALVEVDRAGCLIFFCAGDVTVKEAQVNKAQITPRVRCPTIFEIDAEPGIIYLQLSSRELARIVSIEWGDAR